MGATGGSAGLDAVDAHAVENMEGGDEAGGVHVVDEQLRAGAGEEERARGGGEE